MAVSETVLDRLAKLMNFAANATGPEAEVAAQRAAELMAKYQVDEAEIASRTQGTAPQIEKGRVDADEGEPAPKSFQSWKGIMVVAIAKSFGGCCYKNGTQIIMFGPPGSVAATRYLYKALTRELERRVRRFLKETGGRGPQGNAFLHGATTRICVRLEEGRKSAVKEASSQALVVLDKTAAAAQEAMASSVKLGKPKAVRRTTDDEARVAGWVSAEDLDLGDKGRLRLDEPDKELE